MVKQNDLSAKGPSQRQLRVGEMLRRAVSDVLLRGDIHDADLAHVSVTVGEVRSTPDLKLAIVYVLPLGGENANIVIDALNRNKYEIRRSVNKLVLLKYSPDLKFVLDRTFDQLDETRRLLDQEIVKKDVESSDDL
ncbi:30S ribosome-binding factor RbfA [Amylibacter sp.]|nr:30S ribosome-binding factor RbfA [Amylibacter sp.]MDC1264444.1 30S ribosome-binding factor RbfA [Amylibacter sp.]